MNCALGWATIWFDEIGRKSLNRNNSSDYETMDGVCDPQRQKEINFFGITKAEYNYLFYGSRHRKYPHFAFNLTPKQYIKVLHQFMTIKHRENNHWYNRLKLAWQKIVF